MRMPMEDKMKILIAGDGKVGASLTRELTAAGYDITLIDSKQNVLDSSIERFDVMAIRGNCASMEILEEAGVKDADLLIAVTSADEVNLLCCLTAHGMNPDIHTIARIRNPEYSKQIYRMRGTFALSLSVNPEKQAAIEIEHLLKYPGFLKRDSFAKGRLEIVELRIGSDSKLKDLALNDLDSVAKCKVLVCVVLRKGKVIAPDGNFVLQEGDRIFVTAPTDNLTILLKNLGIITHKVRRVMICGGGKVSYYLAERLKKSGMIVQIIEQDYEKCLDLAKRLPEASIIHGDASNQALLESEGIQDCDALITMTGMDEQNIIISLYGNNCGVPQVITKVGHLDHTKIIENLPIGSIVSPKELCTNAIVRYVRAMHNQEGAAITVYGIADGQAEALEFLVEKDTRYCGVPLKNIETKKNILIAGISHKARTEVPDGESSFEVGDTVVVVSGRDEVLYQLGDIFE